MWFNSLRNRVRVALSPALLRCVVMTLAVTLVAALDACGGGGGSGAAMTDNVSPGDAIATVPMSALQR